MIRQANVEDLSRIEAIDERAFKYGSWSKENYQNELKNNPYSNLYVYEKNEILGFIDFWVTFEIGDITRIAVDPEYQGQGIAKELIRFSLEKMRKKSCECCQLEVRESNQTAIHLYKVCGFEKMNIRYRYYENQEDAWVMSRML